MAAPKTRAELDQLVATGKEEDQELDYKKADSLDQADRKKAEITKDVSAFANAAGGVVIYGIACYEDAAREHLPEKIDLITRPEITKEWLEHVINSIRPRISGLSIWPIRITDDAGAAGAVYVVEIPKSATAHQALDKRYYRRYNFEAQPMFDHEIRDVMGRTTLPDADPMLGYVATGRHETEVGYRLVVGVQNNGSKVIQHFKLEVLFPNFPGMAVQKSIGSKPTDVQIGTVSITPRGNDDFVIAWRSALPLLPKDYIGISDQIAFRYFMNRQALHGLVTRLNEGPVFVKWALFADDMPVKSGELPFENFHDLAPEEMPGLIVVNR